MATSTFNHSVPQGGVTQTQPGFFAKVAERFVAQRTAKARQMTAWYLSSFSDEQLVSYGWSAAEIKRLRNAD